MNDTSRNTFGFIGFGLIGGSVARGLRKLYPECNIAAYNYYKTKPHKMLEEAKRQGTINEIFTSISDFSKCDVIFLCAPVLKNVAYMKELAPVISKDCILTDVGSVKANIHKEAEKLGLSAQFVGGHPMTGSEKTGYLNSNDAILQNAYYLLTTSPDTNQEYVEWLKCTVQKMGCRTESLDYNVHDQMTAGISHAPHVISAALVNTVSKRDTNGYYKKLAAGGFKDITRISSSSPEMWENICLTNKDEIVCFLDEFILSLDKAKNNIIDGNSEELIKLFSDAKKYRDSLY